MAVSYKSKCFPIDMLRMFCLPPRHVVVVVVVVVVPYIR